MVRVLHVFNNMANGGIENFVMNYYRNMDRAKVQFDFLTSVREPGFFDEEIRYLGGRLFHAYPVRENPVRNFCDIRNVVKANQYSIVHRHTGSAFGYFDLQAAKAGGAKTLILHSHASSAGNGKLHMISKLLLRTDCVRLACSEEAGEHLFGRGKSFEIINNAIDVGKYRYSGEKRRIIREKYNVDGNIILGHVGAFWPVKNHDFMVDVFKELYKKNNLYRLWLVGDGELRVQIEQKVKDLGLSSVVRFWGNRKDVPDLLQAMDQFILPSTYEGFNIAAVEAQCAGLRCFVSSQCAGLSCFDFLPLKDGAEKWASEIYEKGALQNRDGGAERIREANFDIKDAVRDLERRYLTYAEK